MTDREKPSAATSVATGSGLAEQALSVLLTHSYTAAGDDSDSDNADLLDIATLGNLSVVSPHLLSLTQPAWRLLYRRAVTAGSPAYAVETTTYLWRSDTLLNTWSGEDGLTPCFAAPHPDVISRLPGQYKTAAACLLTKTCATCGECAATAHPLTFRRLCDDCTRDDVGGYLILKSRAKAAFLVGEADLRPLEKYSVTLPVMLSGRECHSTVYLLSDVRSLAYDKWGGREALARRIDVREGRIVEHGRATRAAKRQKTESSDTSNENGGRMTTRSSTSGCNCNEDGDEREPYRPFEDDLALRCWIDSIPIGVLLDDGRMVGAVECKDGACGLRGSVRDIALHERLEHGMRHLGFDADPDMEFNTEVPEDLATFDNDVLEHVPNEREFRRKTVFVMVMPDDGETPPMPMVREMCSCTIKLDDEDVTVASDLLHISTFDSVNEFLAGNFEDAEEKGVYKLSCQLKPYGMAMELLRIGVGFDSDMYFEAPLEHFNKLTAALGLPATQLNAAQLLASLILSSQPKEAFLGTVLVKPCDCGAGVFCAYRKGIPNDETPIFRTAIEIMTNGFVTSGPLIRVQGAGIAGVNGYYRRRDNDFTKEGTYEGEKVTFSISPRKGSVGPGNDMGEWILRVYDGSGGACGCLYSCKNGKESVPAESGWERVGPPNAGPAPSLTVIS